MEDLIKQLEDYCTREHNRYLERMKKKDKRVNDNLIAVKERSIKLNKPIPDEILATIILDQSRGSKFFEQFKEWFE